MGKIDRKRTRCCNKYVCTCMKNRTLEQKYPWKSAINGDKNNRKQDAQMTERKDTSSRLKYQDGRNKKSGFRVNKLPWS